MSDILALDSLEIKNFRAFKQLRIERLSRVNLIVGKNNVGKTSLLEAVWVYAEGGLRSALRELLVSRDEASDLDFNGSAVTRMKTSSRLYNWSQIQSQRGSPSDDVTDLELIATISPISGNHSELKIEDTWLAGIEDKKKPRLITNYICRFIRAGGLGENEIRLFWDNVTLIPQQEGFILDALRIIHPGIEQIGLVDAPGNSASRIAKARIAISNGPVPLRSLGEGMNRMFGLALAMVNCKDGILLVDEIDTGLHYSVLTKMWKLVFETAHRLNVQVFATTHSKDCLEAFSEVLHKHEAADGVVIQLRGNPDKPGIVEATAIDDRILEIAMREDIEVRN